MKHQASPSRGLQSLACCTTAAGLKSPDCLLGVEQTDAVQSVTRLLIPPALIPQFNLLTVATVCLLLVPTLMGWGGRETDTAIPPPPHPLERGLQAFSCYMQPNALWLLECYGGLCAAAHVFVMVASQ